MFVAKGHLMNAVTHRDFGLAGWPQVALQPAAAEPCEVAAGCGFHDRAVSGRRRAVGCHAHIAQEDGHEGADAFRLRSIVESGQRFFERTHARPRLGIAPGDLSHSELQVRH